MKDIEKRLSQLEEKVRILELLMENNQSNWDAQIRINKISRHPQNPLVDGWICPYCGKRVYSMEVHSCNQPYCGGRYVVE